MGDSVTDNGIRAELYHVYHAVCSWFTSQPLPPDRWHEISEMDVDIDVAMRFASAVDAAKGLKLGCVNRLATEEPIARVYRLGKAMNRPVVEENHATKANSETVRPNTGQV